MSAEMELRMPDQVPRVGTYCSLFSVPSQLFHRSNSSRHAILYTSLLLRARRDQSTAKKPLEAPRGIQISQKEEK
jgi:hypothetical protein